MSGVSFSSNLIIKNYKIKFMDNELKNFFTDLQKREVIADYANLDNFFNLERIQKCLYLGIDCTNDSLHIGHLFQFIQLVRFAQKEFRIILILGGATSKIGDPSDKLKERPQLEKAELNNYYQQIEKQIINLLLKEKRVSELSWNPLELFYSDNQDLLTNIYQLLKLDKNKP